MQRIAMRFRRRVSSPAHNNQHADKRFVDQLRRFGKEEEYLGLLVNHFNPETVEGLMCRHLVSVGYDGTLYDCDFNQMLEMPIRC